MKIKSKLTTTLVLGLTALVSRGVYAMYCACKDPYGNTHKFYGEWVEKGETCVLSYPSSCADFDGLRIKHFPFGRTGPEVFSFLANSCVSTSVENLETYVGRCSRED